MGSNINYSFIFKFIYWLLSRFIFYCLFFISNYPILNIFNHCIRLRNMQKQPFHLNNISLIGKHYYKLHKININSIILLTLLIHLINNSKSNYFKIFSTIIHFQNYFRRFFNRKLLSQYFLNYLLFKILNVIQFWLIKIKFRINFIFYTKVLFSCNHQIIKMARFLNQFNMVL